MKLATIIKQARLKKKMSQRDLATVLGHATHQFISNLERNRSCIPPKEITKYSKALGIPFKVLEKEYLLYCKSKIR